MRIAYVRISTKEQLADRQLAALEKLSDELHIEQVSANRKKRPVFLKVRRKLRRGDTLVILDLDRAFRDTVEALRTMYRLQERGIELQVLSLNINTATPEGELMYTVTAAYARYEWRCLSRRTKQGMAEARAKGKQIGRPPKNPFGQMCFEWL